MNRIYIHIILVSFFCLTQFGCDSKSKIESEVEQAIYAADTGTAPSVAFAHINRDGLSENEIASIDSFAQKYMTLSYQFSKSAGEFLSKIDLLEYGVSTKAAATEETLREIDESINSFEKNWHEIRVSYLTLLVDLERNLNCKFDSAKSRLNELHHHVIKTLEVSSRILSLYKWACKPMPKNLTAEGKSNLEKVAATVLTELNDSHKELLTLLAPFVKNSGQTLKNVIPNVPVQDDAPAWPLQTLKIEDPSY